MYCNGAACFSRRVAAGWVARCFSTQPQPAANPRIQLHCSAQRPTLTSRCGRRGSSALVEPCSTITYLQGEAQGAGCGSMAGPCGLKGARHMPGIYAFKLRRQYE